MTKKWIIKLYTGVIGALAMLAIQKALTAGWKAATGDEPPSQDDPAVPWKHAIIWAAASAIGVGITQLLTTRFTAKRLANIVEDKT